MPGFRRHLRYKTIFRRSYYLPLVVVMVVTAFITLPLFQSSIASAGPHDGNRTTNWSFEGAFTSYQGGEVGNNWTPFVIGQNAPSFRNTAEFNPGWVERIDGNTSQMIWANGPSFTAGLYQKIDVTPCTAYVGFYCTASVGGGARTIGIDPYGGTDPQSPNVVWGTTFSQNGGWATIELGTAPNVRVISQSSQITLFIKVTSDGGLKQVFIDAVELTPSSTIPAATQLLAGTPTPAPYAVYLPAITRCFDMQSAQPTSTPTPTPTPPTSGPYSFQSISWEPNCGMMRILIYVGDNNGNPIDGIVLRYETADGANTARSNPTGQPGVYDHGWTDFILQSSDIFAYTWRVWVVDDMDNMLSAKVDVTTTAGCGADGHQVATVRFRKN